jgi:WS/DGAT/MGAT family acyltransferase
MHFIEGVEHDRFALYIKIHHALVDGVSATRLFQSSMSTRSRQRKMPPLWACGNTTPTGTGVSAGTLRAVADQLQSQVGAIPGAMRGLAGFAGSVFKRDPHGLKLPFQAPYTSLNGPISAARRFVAQSYSLSRIKAVGKALDATVNDIVLAMASSALRRYLATQDDLPARSLTAMAPVSVRPAGPNTLGNAVSAVFVSLATDIDEPVRRLRAIQRSIGEGKALLATMTVEEITWYTLAASLPSGLPALLHLAGHGPPPFNLTISNVPGSREPLYWNGARLEGSYPVSIVMDGSAVNITVTSYADSLDFGIIACRRSVPAAQRLIDHLETGIAELEQAASL